MARAAAGVAYFAALFALTASIYEAMMGMAPDDRFYTIAMALMTSFAIGFYATHIIAVSVLRLFQSIRGH